MMGDDGRGKMKQLIKRVFLPVMAGIMILVVPGCKGGSDRSDTHTKNAQAYYARQDYRRAADHFRRIAGDYPDSVNAWLGLAKSCVKLGDVGAATEAYRRVLGIAPEHAEALLGLARFDLLAGNLMLAEKRISDVLDRNPADISALFLLADLYNRTGRFRPAIETYAKILPLASDKTAVLTGLARTQARAGDLEAALESLEKAVLSAPESLEPRLLLFNFFYGQGKFQRAETVLLQAIDGNPDNATLRILLGQFYFNRSQMDAAESAFLKAVDLEPDQTRAYLIAGKFYNAVKNPRAALEMLQKAGRLRPRDVKISTLLAEFYLDNDSLANAGRIVDDILKEHPGYYPARLLEVRILLAQNAYTRAIDLCDAYLKSNPAADQLLVLKGRAHVEQGDLAAAEQVLSEAVTVAPSNMDAGFRLLDVYLKLGKIDLAQQLSREIFTFLHKNFDVTVVLGDTELHRKKFQKGLDSLDSLSRFASANPFDRFRAQHLDRLRTEYDRLMSEFSRILEQRPELINVFENIILLHAVRKEYDTALRKCDRQAERLKNRPELVAKIENIRAGVYLAQNKRDRAEEAFKRAIALYPDYVKPYYGLAKIYIMNKDIKSAIEQYEALLTKDPDQPVPHLLLGVLNKMTMNFNAAADHYRKALELDSDFIRAANNLAYLLVQQGENLEEALSLALHAKQLSPDDPYVQDTLGWVYYRQGRYNEAVGELTRAADLLPDNATVNFHLGMAHYRNGDAPKARRFLEKALQAGSGIRETEQIKEILGKLY